MRAAQETCSRAGSIVDPDAIIHPDPAYAVLRDGAVGCVWCAVGLATTPRRSTKAAETVHVKHQTPARKDNFGRLRVQREKNQRTPLGEA